MDDDESEEVPWMAHSERCVIYQVLMYAYHTYPTRSGHGEATQDFILSLRAWANFARLKSNLTIRISLIIDVNYEIIQQIEFNRFAGTEVIDAAGITQVFRL